MKKVRLLIKVVGTIVDKVVMEGYSKELSSNLTEPKWPKNKTTSNKPGKGKCVKVEDEHVQKPELGIWGAQLYVLSKWAVTTLSRVDKIWEKKRTSRLYSKCKRKSTRRVLCKVMNDWRFLLNNWILYELKVFVLDNRGQK